MSDKSVGMEVDVSVGAPVPDQAILDGALGDDERTEVERSPKEKQPPAAAAMERSPPSDAAAEPTSRGAAPGINNSEVNGRKKKHRRGKHKGGRRHRQWKPYTKLTWDEKKALEERETRRAFKKREDRFASGQPMAPYNTTQFLMEQHQPSDVNLEESRPRLNKSEAGEGSGGASGSADGSSDEYYSSPDDEEIFLEKEFTEAYENYHAERLQTMSKDELVRDYLELESKVELMEKRTKGQSNGRSSLGTPEDLGSKNEDTLSSSDKSLNSSQTTQMAAEAEVAKLKEELQCLRQENETLRRENEQLRLTQVSNSVNEGEP